MTGRYCTAFYISGNLRRINHRFCNNSPFLFSSLPPRRVSLPRQLFSYVESVTRRAYIYRISLPMVPLFYYFGVWVMALSKQTYNSNIKITFGAYIKFWKWFDENKWTFRIMYLSWKLIVIIKILKLEMYSKKINNVNLVLDPFGKWAWVEFLKLK